MRGNGEYEQAHTLLASLAHDLPPARRALNALAYNHAATSTELLEGNAER